jgi:hypothetical protein
MRATFLGCGYRRLKKNPPPPSRRITTMMISSVWLSIHRGYAARYALAVLNRTVTAKGSSWVYQCQGVSE